MRKRTWHTPIRPPRDLVGERVFAAEWKHVMANVVEADHADHSLTAFDFILAELPATPSKRHSRVLASIVTWFGTNCGGAFLYEAERLRKASPHTRFPYLAQWSVENARFRCSNGGLRTLEHCLATEFEADVMGLGRIGVPPRLTAEDYEVADCLMVWLGGADGQAFLRKCEREIEAQRLHLSPGSRARLGMTAAGQL